MQKKHLWVGFSHFRLSEIKFRVKNKRILKKQMNKFSKTSILKEIKEDHLNYQQLV